VTSSHKIVIINEASLEVLNLKENKVMLELDGKRAWVFHGDVFDISIQKAKWLVKLGGYGYDLLILLNRL